MRISDAFVLSVRMFKARAMRTFLTILGMSVGIGAILFLVSIGYGLQNALLERITTADSLLTLDVTETKLSLIPLNNDYVESIKNIEGVKEVSFATNLPSQGIFNDLAVDMAIMATQPEFFRLGGIRVDKGEIFSEENPRNIIITTALASVLHNKPEELLGKEIKLAFFFDPKKESEEEEKGEFLETAFLRIDSPDFYTISAIIESEESLAYINFDSVPQLPIERFTSVKVRCDSSSAMARVRDEIMDKGFLVSALSDTVDQANKIFQIIQLVLLSFGVIALVVSAIGMFNTMTIALLERTEEIGIMKSIGAFNFDVSLLFVLESTIMGLLGGIGGVFLGQLGGEIMNILINLVATRFGGQAVDLFYSPGWFITLIIGVGAFVGFFTGFLPARRASSIDPLEALRYK